MILNIGCGFNKIKGAINLDIDPRCNPDVTADLTERLPFEDNYFDEVNAIQVLEHIHNFESLMLEIHRVLKLNGRLKVSVPLWPCRNSFAGTGHVRQFVAETFVIYTNPSYFQPRMHPSNYAGLFDLISMDKNEAMTNGNSPVGAWITDLNVVLMKVDKQYWKAKGIQDSLKNDVFGCFYCGWELEKISEDNSCIVKQCPKCKERYTISK